MTSIASPQIPEQAGALGPVVYDPFLWLGERLGMAARRRRLLAQARGAVLEIGAGTGLNRRYYPDGLDRLVLSEPVEGMVTRLRNRAAGAEVVQAGAESLPFPDATFDTVVSTMVLCTAPDPEAAMAEIRRLLKPGGRLLFIEHVRADEGHLSRWQDRLAGPWARLADGCRCDQETLPMLRAAGFDVTDVREERWRGQAPLVAPLRVGSARVV